MKHILCWQSIVPRILLLGVAVLAAKYALSRLVRSVAVDSLQSAVDARVAANYANVSLLKRQFILRDLRFCSPSRPSQVVLQIDRCALDFAAGPLLYKQAVVECGTLTGLRIDLPLSAALALPAKAGAPHDATEVRGQPLRWTGVDSSEKVRHWLTALDKCFEQQLGSQLACVARAEELCARWPAQASEVDARAQELKRRAVKLKQEIAAAQENPLRNVTFFRELPEEIATLRAEFNRADAELESLLGSVDAGRRKITLARRDDEQLVRKALRLGPIDAESLTAYLLREQMKPPLDQVIAILRWIRQEVPARSVPTPCTRGEDVLFVGCTPTPDLLLNKLLLQGTVQIGGHPIQLRGTLSDLTDAPSFHPSPIRLRLRGAGSPPVELQATVDRTGAVARDDILIDCPNIVLPKFFLGHADEFRLSPKPSVGAVSLSARVKDEMLSGDIHLVQKHVQLVPMFSGQLSNVPLAALLQETLSDIDQIAIRVSLTGTLDEPRAALWSNAGTTVAAAIESAVRRAAEQRAQALLVSAQRRIDEQFATLDRLANQQQAELQVLLSTANRELQKIAGQHSPDGRISHEQLGRRLPAGSLFR
jgi:uncharacterized protein (TIGR03545 family)